MSVFWKDRNVFVTGCTGLLGSALTAELVKRKANVVGLVRDGVARSNLRLSGMEGNITVVSGALEDYALLERAINEYEIDTVFHLAAQTIVGTANRNPISTFDANVKGTWNIMEACRRNASVVKRIIVASSDKAYGEHKELPYKETASLRGTHPYDVSKSCADLIAGAYHNTYGTPACITRCGNLFGAGDLNFNRIIPGTIRSVYNGERPIIRSDGTYIRDYFYVLDAVEAYLFLAEKMEGGAVNGEAFNFSNEIQMNVLDLVKLILRLMGRTDIEPVILSSAKGEIMHQYLSAEKARTLLNWTPAYKLEDALKETIDWYTAFLKA